MSKSVRILNSSSGSGWTSCKNAVKMIARGIARIEGNAIRLIETDYRFNSVALPKKKAVIHAPKLPEVLALPWEECWLNSAAAVIRFHGDQQSPYGIRREAA